ncbi:MAG: hypothetical protein HRT53_00930 [Colwellia sp.]|nr:hypothetical protein [Colwellia sp.]
MGKEIVSSADNEHLYLKSNALFSFALGFVFTFDVIDQAFSSIIENNHWVDILLTGMGVIVLLVLVVQLVKTLHAMEGLSKAAFWYGDFQDEYVNFINLKGYKWAFTMAISVLLIFCIFDDLADVAFSSISISDFSEFIVGLIFIAYSLPVIYSLYKDSENE